MTSPSIRPVRPARTRRLVAVAATAGLLATGCTGGGAEESAPSPSASPTPSVSPSPSSTVPVPPTVSLTEVGADLSFGDTATVIYEPNQKRGTVLELTVDRVREGKIEDLSAFILEDQVKASTPYYAHVTVKNVGEGDVGGAPVPLWGVDPTRTLLPPAIFTTRFQPCESKPLPKRFPPGKSVDTCLVFLAPDGGDLQAVSFRPNQQFDPIEWTGKVKEPKQAGKKPGKKSGDKKSGDKKSDGKGGKGGKGGGKKR